MRGHRVFVGVIAIGVFTMATMVAACGDDESSGTVAPSSEPSVSTPVDTSATTTSAAPTTTAPASTTTAATTTVPQEPMRPAVWPAPDVVFATPEEAAADFLFEVYGFAPVLGEFQAGDARSGEIEVFASEDGVTALGDARSTLVMRQMGPDDGWFVLSAASPLATVDVPAPGATVQAAPLDVSGAATGFEATIVVTAFVTGAADPPLDNQVVMAGNMGDPQPYATTLDISGAAAGDTVVVLVRGGVGLEFDPGDFSAIPVVVQ